MRALSIVLVLILVLSLATVAGASKYPFGIKGGITWTWADWSEGAPDGLQKMNSTMAGFFVEFPLTSAISLQPEVMYTNKGYRVAASDGGAVPETDYNLNYADIPLLAKLNMTFGASRPYLIIGPSVNFLVSANSTTEFTEKDIKSRFKSTDFGMVAGIGINMKSVLLEGRYSVGLSNANDTDGIKNSILGILFGITF